MARTRHMLQIEMVNIYAGDILAIPPIHAVVFDIISTPKVVVSEISAIETGVFMGNRLPNFDILESAWCRVWLGFPGARFTYLYPPSHVPSPEFEDAILAVLQVRQWGMTFSDRDFTSSLRGTRAHAYFDWIDDTLLSKLLFPMKFLKRLMR